jgi:hypothetical protein
MRNRLEEAAFFCFIAPNNAKSTLRRPQKSDRSNIIAIAHSHLNAAETKSNNDLAVIARREFVI